MLNVPYVSQYQTGGGGNGINNFFGTNPTANTNQIAIVDNGDVGEATIFATPNGSIVDSLQTTTGIWKLVYELQFPNRFCPVSEPALEQGPREGVIRFGPIGMLLLDNPSTVASST